MSSESLVKRLVDDLGERPVRRDLTPVSHGLDHFGVDRFSSVVQVVGTNGKGSVIHYLEAVLVGSNLDVVSYTSPHFHHPAERFSVNGDPVSKSRFRDCLKRVHRRLDEPLTPFELLFLVAVGLGENVDADLLLLEAGMGGRWDATSALGADVTVLTSVEREHTTFLGEELESIAREMVAQIPSDTTLVTSDQVERKVGDVLEDTAKKKELTRLTVASGDTVSGRLKELAATVVHRLTGTPRNQLHRRLQGVEPPPGRRERVEKEDGRWLLDVAHTPEAVRALFEEGIPPMEDFRMFCLFGCLEGKKPRAMLDEIKRWIPHRRIELVEPSVDRGLSPVEYAGDHATGNRPDNTQLPSAITRLDERTGSDDLIVVTGSFALVGAVKQLLETEA